MGSTGGIVNHPTIKSISVQPLLVIKIGGNIVDNNETLAAFLRAFASLPQRKILVHGGGKIATRIGETLGIQSKYIDGRRITDGETIDLVTMVYAGLINKKMIAQLQSLQCNAIGVTGADANLIPAARRPVKDIDYGFVGDVKSDQLDASSWKLLLDANLVPVVAPITHDGNGQLLNTNADTMAQEVAKALSTSFEVSLVYSFEKPGVLLDANDDSTVIASINPAKYKTLKDEQKIFAGMIPKMDNAFAALNNGVAKVIIGKAENIHDLLKGISGTTITNE
jgi:acetylglutamate kinase